MLRNLNRHAPALLLATALSVLPMAHAARAALSDSDGTRRASAVTPFLSPSSSNAVTTSAGDNNGFQTNASLAFSDGGGGAVDTNSGTNTNTGCLDAGKDKHNFTYFVNVGVTGTLPTSATITGIELRLDASADSTTGAPILCARLSSDSGATWTTTVLSTTTLTTGEVTYSLGNSTQLWGRTWVPNDFASNKFRVQVIPVSSNTSRDFTLDWVAARVHFN
jgi:hypothetical protein